jgi:hypothetical protein
MITRGGMTCGEIVVPFLGAVQKESSTMSVSTTTIAI